MSNTNDLAVIQLKVKAPKGQFNSFGKYKYRSCEDIVEAVKPVINPLGYSLTLSDSIIEAGGRVYVQATATLTNGANTYTVTALAREEDIKKGMDASQITGAASSYARKYALNGLFAIDDTKDSDATNDHSEKPEKKPETPTDEERYLLKSMVYDTDMTPDEKEKAMAMIDLCTDYNTYQKIQYRLEERQKSLDQIPNPSQKDISKHIKKVVGNVQP